MIGIHGMTDKQFLASEHAETVFRVWICKNNHSHAGCNEKNPCTEGVTVTCDWKRP